MFLKNIIIFLTILPLLYKLLFWLYVIQLKEYRFDRFKEYLSTRQWKKAIFNIFFILETIIFFIVLLNCFNLTNENIVIYSFILLLWTENLYILYKILKKQIIFPEKTTRSILLLWFNFLSLILIFLLLYFYKKIFYVVFIFAIFPFYVLIWNLILTPFVNFKKKKIFKKAQEKTKNLSLHIIWITWSFWKTSMKEYIASIISSQYNVFKTPKNINTELWLANLILNINFSWHNFFVAEMWAYKKWEIKQIWEIVNHKDGFLTWIWNQHISLFQSQQNIIDWKSEIWEKILENNWKLYINDNIKIKDDKIIVDNKEYNLWNTIKKLLEKNKIVFYWLSNDQAFSKIIKIDQNGTEFEFNYKQKKYRLTTNLIWKWQIENLTWALAFGVDNGIENLQKAIENIRQPEHTLNILKKEDITIIDDTYNLSVNWLLNGLDIISYFTWKKILIVDDILELWKNAEQIHYELWKKLSNNFDNIFFVWINYKESFEKWVKSSNWNLIDNLWENLENTTLLFEWRNAWKILKKLMIKF